MKRDIYADLLKWKDSARRKPIILEGARQVGKTWILKEFGSNEFKNMVYVNCDKNELIKTIFRDFDIHRILKDLSALAGVPILPNETIIILDEVQELPIILTSLKYFNELASEYHIIVAGSLLGIQLHEGTGFPVGQVDEMKMYPLSFNEFFDATCDNEQLKERLNSNDFSSIDTFSSIYVDYLKQYYYVGGMPEVVNVYVQSKDFEEVRKTQNQILKDYRHDFSKHINNINLPKVNMVFESIPSQLAKENKKFIYGALKKGARAKDYEDAIRWLIDAGMIYKVNRVRDLKKPLHFYEDKEAFKLFFVDLGLLGALTKTKARDVVIDDSVFVEYKGSFTEQFVLQQYVTSTKTVPYYYSKSNSTLELDFLTETNVINPIEVKAEKNVYSKSMKSTLETNPSFVGWRFSMKNYMAQEKIINIPLYVAFSWFKENIK